MRIPLASVLLLTGCLTSTVHDEIKRKPDVAAVAPDVTAVKVIAAWRHADGTITLRTLYTDQAERCHRWSPAPAARSPGSISACNDTSHGRVVRRVEVEGPAAELRVVGGSLERREADGSYRPIGSYPVVHARCAGGGFWRSAGLVALLPFAFVADVVTLPLQGLFAVWLVVNGL